MSHRRPASRVLTAGPTRRSPAVVRPLEPRRLFDATGYAVAGNDGLYTVD